MIICIKRSYDRFRLFNYEQDNYNPEPYIPSEGDYAIVSNYLRRETVKSIKEIVSSCYIVKSINEPIKNTNFIGRTLQQNMIISYPDDNVSETPNIYLEFPDTIESWAILLFVYISSSNRKPSELPKDILYYTQIYHDWKMDRERMVAASNNYKLSLRSYIKRIEPPQNDEYPYINNNILNKELNKRKIKSFIHNDLVICEFTNVKVGNEQEGYLIYNKIIVIIKNFVIEGFMFRFEGFDYSSYWNIPISLHPNLAIGLPSEFMFPDVYAKSLKDLVTVYKPNQSIISISDIIADFQNRRKLWATNRFLIKDRTQLSKFIFSE